MRWLLGIVPALTLANPSGCEVVHGTATVEAGQEQLIISASDRAILHWERFSIEGGETTRFTLPSSQAAVVNRVVSANPSHIFGRLESNGSVYLINPNGVLIGKEGVVQTAGFLASTLEMKGEQLFIGDSKESVVNLGTIEAGEVFLLGLHVVNEGKISANAVNLGGGSLIILSPAEDRRIWIAPVQDGTVENTGAIEALHVELAACGSPYSLAVNHTGTIDASRFVEAEGRIFLVALEGGVALSGAVKAPLGTVEVSGSYFAYEGKVDTQGIGGGCGTLLFDPNDIDITLAPTDPAPFSGTFFDGAGVPHSNLNATELTSALALNNVTIQTHLATPGGNGDILFFSPVIWNSANSLTVLAERDVNILTLVKNGGTGGIAVTSGRDFNVGPAAAPCQIGSRAGDLTFYVAGAVSVRGGAVDDAFAQVGYDDPSIASNIAFNADVDALSVLGGSGARAYALIGHGSDQSAGGTKTGNITFSSGAGSIAILGGSGHDAFAQVGIARGKLGPVIGTGNVIVSYLASSTTVEGGMGSGSYALFGHGGGDSIQSDSFSGDIKVYTQSGIVHGRAGGSFAAVGYYAEASGAAAVVNTANLIDVTSGGSLTIQADDGAEAYVGARVVGASGTLTIQKINIEATTLSLLGSTPSGGASNFTGLGASTTLGTAASSLTLKTEADLTMTSGVGGVGVSTVTIQNGSGAPAGSWPMTLSINNSAALQAATLSSIGTLTVNVASQSLTLNAASITSAKELVIFAGQNLILTNAFIQTAADNLKIDTGALLTLNPNSYLRNVGTNNGRIVLKAGSDLSIIGAPGASAYIENLGNNANWLCALQDINIYATIQNSGTGRFVLNAVRDINIGRSTSLIPCQIGTALGTPINVISTRNLNVIGGSAAGAFAQIGADAASVASQINLLEVSGDINVLGGSGSGAFAAIGHGRIGGLGGTKTGNILFTEIGGNFLIQGGSGANAYAQVGHCHGTDFAVTLTGDVQAKEIGGSLHIYGGSGSNAYALFGHGGSSFAAGDNYTGAISAHAAEVAIAGGTQPSALAGFGFTNGKTAAAGSVTVTSTMVMLCSDTTLSIAAGSGSQAHAFLGASLDTGLPSVVNVTTVIADAQGPFSLTGSALAADASTDLGVVNGNGACGNNLSFSTGSSLTAIANTGGVQIRNGTGAPAGTYLWSGSSLGAASFQGVGVSAIGSLAFSSGSLTLNSSSWTSPGNLSAVVSGNLSLTSSSMENTAGAFTVSVGGDLTLGAGCFLRNNGVGDLLVTASNCTIIGAGAFIHNLGAGDYTLTALNDLTINAALQNPGTGVHTVAVGRDLLIGTNGGTLHGRLEAPNSSLMVTTGRHLTLTASGSYEASLLAGEQMTVSIGSNGTLNGSGSPAFIQAASGSFEINAGDDLVLNPNSFIRHQGTDNGDLAFDVRQDLKITGPSSFIYNLGAGNLHYHIHRDFVVNADVQNPGTGNIDILTGRDFLLGQLVNTQRAHFGLVNGDLTVTVNGTLSVIAGGANDAFAQLGGQAAGTITSNITVVSVGGDLNIIADSGINTFAQIGNRSPDPITGIVTVGEVGGTTTITPGVDPSSYAQIGNYIGPVIP